MPCVEADSTCEDASFCVSLDVLYYMMLFHDRFLVSLVRLTRVPLYLTAAKVHFHLILSRSTSIEIKLVAEHAACNSPTSTFKFSVHTDTVLTFAARSLRPQNGGPSFRNSRWSP